MKHEVSLQYNIKVWKLKHIIKVIQTLLMITKDNIMTTNKDIYLQELKKKVGSSQSNEFISTFKQLIIDQIIHIYNNTYYTLE